MNNKSVNQYDDSCTKSYSELSQTIDNWFYPSTIFSKATSQMLNYAQKTRLILYDKS